MKLPYLFLSVPVCVVLASLNAVSPALSEVVDYRFQVDVLSSGMPQPMQLKVAPDGRIFFNEIGGVLKVWKPELKAVVTAGKLEVFNGQENGFLGFALDPKFAENQWIYCLYSPTDFKGQRLSRFKMNGDILDRASEKAILTVEEQRDQCCHHAGAVQFDAQGNLFFSLGDNTNPFGSDGYSPADETPGREPWDAQRTSANTANLIGKIIRIRPTPDGGYTIPEGNLFPEDGSKGRPEIYVMGCRNPWRISIDPRNGFLYWGDVGPDARNDGPRGSRGYDELNQARKAGFFGWPYFVGNNFSYGRYNFETKEIGAPEDPMRPMNRSRNNTGLKELPPAQPAWIYWPYGDSEPFPMLASGGRTACAGPVFHHQASFDRTNGFPAEYDGALLFWDWQRPFMKWARMNAQGDLQGIEPFSSAFAVVPDKVREEEVTNAFVLRRPVDAQFGPDGCLYLLDYGLTWGANADAKLLRISYVRGNLPPVVAVQSSVSSGKEPLKVRFTSEGTHKREGGALRYAWRLQPGGPVVSTEPTFETTFEKVGKAEVELTVSDEHQGSRTKTASVVVGNTVAQVEFESPRDGDFFTPGQPVEYKVRVRDAEDGESSVLGDAMGLRVMVEGRWQKSVDDKPVVDPGLALMKQSDCFNCHQVDKVLVGPPLLEVAKRYRGVAGALEATVLRVRNGSSGVWGPIPMLAHPQHTSDEIAQMVAWVFALEPGKAEGSGQRGLTGTMTAPKDPKIGIGILEAAYADGGRGEAPSLIGKMAVQLRNRRVAAAGSETPTGCRVLSGGGASSGKFLGSINDGNSTCFKNIPLSQVGGFTCRVSSGGAGGKIELRAGAVNGPVLAEVEVTPTGSWTTWVEKSAPVEGAASLPERADVYAVFVNPGKSGLMNLDWIQFNPPKKG